MDVTVYNLSIAPQGRARLSCVQLPLGKPINFILALQLAVNRRFFLLHELILVSFLIFVPPAPLDFEFGRLLFWTRAHQYKVFIIELWFHIL